MNIREVSIQIHKNAKAKGFYDREINVGEKLMLVVSELSEALEAHRQKRLFGDDTGAFDIHVNYFPEQFKKVFEENVKDTFEDEMADAAIRIFDLCESMGIDLEWHIEKKMKYNTMREKLHGKLY